MINTTIALVDDHKLFRDGIASLINSFNLYTVILEADNGEDLIKKLDHATKPDIVLLDINMKNMDGYQTAAWLRVHCPDTKILILSMYENENSIIRMLRLGARGYILKDITKQELQDALKALIAKGYYYTELVTGKLIHAINHIDETQKNNSLKNILSLSDKEMEFLKLCCSELTYKAIAERMNLSIHTIDGYRDSLFEKLSIKNRVGLVLYAIKNKIVIVE